jgi:putative flavoprotein involved in K+ transport
MSERFGVLVIGGGQAGLAAGYYLAQQGRTFKILDAAAEPAAAWRARWESLTLFTPVRYDSLPGRPFPGDPDSYPDRDQVASYLTDYARHFELPVELESQVRSVRADDRGYLVELDDRTYESDQVIVATGPFQVPRVPAFASDLHADVAHFHSAEYQRPDALPPGPVLVVGGGNTGFQIAAELAETHEVHLAIGSRQIALPQRLFGRDLFRWLDATGLMGKTVNSRIGQRMKDSETLVGSGPRGLRRKHGVKLHPRAAAAGGTEVTFGDATHLTVSTVIWATGFGIDHSWIDVPTVFDADGRVVHERGVTASAGLYFLGLPWQHTRGSALLGWVKEDAKHIAEQIAALRPPRPSKPAETATTPALELET